MRCVAGFVLFVVLYFGSCAVLDGIVRKTSGRAAAVEALRKYHALVAVGAGVVSLFCCSLPTLLLRASQSESERLYAEWNQQR
jgi:hypothetical protein